MDLSQNNITGTLLHWSEELRKLTDLSLEGNKFFGQIPSSIRNLSMLKDLSQSSTNLFQWICSDLDPFKQWHCRLITRTEYLEAQVIWNHNNISGTIAASITALPFLSYLNLSCNKLHGEVPNGAWFLWLTTECQLEMLVFVETHHQSNAKEIKASNKTTRTGAWFPSISSLC